jgi:deazaflavin-dependent oxidoreductase (nitroreductase family)
MGNDTHGGPLHRLDRWLYRGGRPNRLARLINRAWAVLSSTGLVMPNRLMTLEVRGRSTGRTVTLPVVVADHDGSRYLVSMLGEDANWVRNVCAANGQAVLRHGKRETVHLEEVDPGTRAPVLRRYLAVAPGARPHMPIDWRAPLSEFERIADRYPVFRITADPPRS